MMDLIPGLCMQAPLVELLEKKNYSERKRAAAFPAGDVTEMIRYRLKIPLRGPCVTYLFFHGSPHFVSAQLKPQKLSEPARFDE
ncbi:hypothetical protein BaRGS_00003384, partial [Batillaria attramentaria]